MMIIAKISSLVKTKDMTKERKIPTMKIEIHGDIKEHFKQRLIVRMSFSLLWLLGCQFRNNFHFSSRVRSEICSKMQSCAAGQNHNGPEEKHFNFFCQKSMRKQKIKLARSSLTFKPFALFHFLVLFVIFGVSGKICQFSASFCQISPMTSVPMPSSLEIEESGS